jgi:Kef-type K+ transport system membrane component KefB
LELNPQNGALLLLIAAVVAMVTRRLRLPYSVGLVAAGIGLTAIPAAPAVTLTKDLLLRCCCRRCCSKLLCSSIGSRCGAIFP